MNPLHKCSHEKQTSHRTTAIVKIVANILICMKFVNRVKLALLAYVYFTETNKKIIKYAGIFSKMRHSLPEECRNTLYNSFVFSRLNYGIEVYVNVLAQVRTLAQVITSSYLGWPM